MTLKQHKFELLTFMHRWMVSVLISIVLHNLLLAESTDAEVGIQKEPQIWRQAISYTRKIFN